MTVEAPFQPVAPRPKPRRIASLPPSSVVSRWPELASRLDESERLRAQARAVSARIEELNKQRNAATHADQAAYAEALRASKPAPRQVHTEKVQSDRGEAVRRRQALLLAIDAVADEVATMVLDQREEWITDLDGEIAGARQEVQTAVETWHRTRAALGERLALLGWLKGFADREAWRPSPTKVGDELLETVAERLRADVG